MLTSPLIARILRAVKVGPRTRAHPRSDPNNGVPPTGEYSELSVSCILIDSQYLACDVICPRVYRWRSAQSIGIGPNVIKVNNARDNHEFATFQWHNSA
jgi:hypothetical protein